jgi:MFS family permease
MRPRFAMILDVSPLRKHRDYRLLFIGQTVSFLGSMLTYVAVPYQVFHLTHSSFLVGMLGAVQLVPLLAAALFGGALADSLDRRRLLVGSELAMTGASAALAVNASLARPSIVLVFAASAVMSAVNGFHRPALDAMTPRLVTADDLPAVSALGSLRFNLGAIGGPACAGFLISAFGVPATYLIDVATFAVSIVSLAALKPPPRPAGELASPLLSIVEGLRYARSREELIGTYVVDIVAMIFAMPMALFPLMGERWGGATATGWLYSSMSIGSLAMTLLSGWTGGVRRHGAAVVIAASLWGVAIVGLGFATSLPLAVACLACAGAADMVSGIFRGTIWNQTIPDKLRGRLAGIEMISYMTGPLLGNARAGWVASRTSAAFSIVSGGLLCVAGVLVSILLLPGFWRYSRPSSPPLAESPVGTTEQSAP